MMSTTELKQKLFKQIESIDNDEALEELYRILALGSYNKGQNPISAELKDSIDKGLEDYKQGRYYSNEQAKKEFKEWLNK